MTIAGYALKYVPAVFQATDAQGIAEFLAVAAHVAFDPHKQGLEPFQLHLLQLGAGHQLVAAVEDVHSQISLPPLPR